jgi:SH3-like domain-containing protein
MRIYTIIITLFITLSSGVAMAERLAVSASVANIRSGPGTEYDVIWQVGKYHPIQVIKKSGTWYRFHDFEQDEGWIHKSLVSKIRTVITKKKKSNIRSGPGTRHKIVFTVEKGIPFRVIKRKGSWIFIEHADGDKGWIYEALVW